MPFIQMLLKVKRFVEVSHNKYKKMMASALWNLGLNTEGIFKMDVLIGVIDGAMTSKAHIPPSRKCTGIGAG